MNEYEYNFLNNLIRKTFSERLKNIRYKEKMSQAQFAAALGISIASLSYYERGERMPDIAFLYKVQECFNIPDGYLLGNTNSLTKDYANISNELCLSDEAINKIKEYVDENDYFDHNDYTNNILSRLLESDELYSVIKLIAWNGFESNNKIPDKDYLDYISTTKLFNLITSIRKDIRCEPKIEPISKNQSIQNDYTKWLFEKMKNNELDVNKKYKDEEDRKTKMIESWREEYKETERYKALCNLKEAPDNGNNNSKDK